MLPDRVSNPGPLTYESCALPIALRGPAKAVNKNINKITYVRPAKTQISLGIRSLIFGLRRALSRYTVKNI